jgi:hypothetical protein
MVCTQEGKPLVLAGWPRRDDVADLDQVVGDDHAVDQEF